MCSSPKLIAAYHVLHRLLEPRHPPCALNCFKKIDMNSKRIRIIKIYSVLQLYFPNMSKNLFLQEEFDDVMNLNQQA